MSTGFFVPCMPDMFSTFGLTNIGQALRKFGKHSLKQCIVYCQIRKEIFFPKNFVKFLGFTIYNAKSIRDKTH